MAKRGGGKKSGVSISKIKRSNHLKQKKNRTAAPMGGKKVKHLKPTPQSLTKTVKGKNKAPPPQQKPKKGKKQQPEEELRPKQKKNEEIEDDFDIEDVADMLDDDDNLNILRNVAQQKDFSLFQGHANGEITSRKRKKPLEQTDDLESAYEDNLKKSKPDEKPKKNLLPIKTKQGIIERSIEVEEEEEENEEEEVPEEMEAAPEVEPPKSVAEMYARRQERLEKLKTDIGSIASGIMENPEEKIGGFEGLLKILDESEPDLYITSKKLVCATVIELVKDLAPSFEIKHTNQEGQKLKKDTQRVYGFEDRLLKYYRLFLVKLEKMFEPVKEGSKKKKAPVSETTKRVAIVGLRAMADLFVALPYFNFSTNIVNALVPFTAHRDPEIRQPVCAAFRGVFRNDKKGEVSLAAVRQVNHLIKNHRYRQVPPDCLNILLALRIKDVNLDKEKEDEINRYKTLTRKEKLLILSKAERRRKKKIERLQREIVEAKAEQKKGSKLKFQTEIVKMVFTIFFRILKSAPKSELLGVVLEGLAKFAHTINVEFFTDLIEVLNGLIEDGDVDYRQCLHAIQVVLTILSGQGEALNIDPLKFYSHLYAVLFSLTAGPSNGEVPIALDCLDSMLIKRRKKVSLQRVLAFVKRLCTLAMQLQHNGSGAILGMVRSIMMTHRQADILLDLDSSAGNGVFLPELDEPEHCNAGSSALWELHSLTRHYHPLVKKLASFILIKCPSTGEGSLTLDFIKKTPFMLFEEYSPANMAFVPAVPAPSTSAVNWRKIGPEKFHSEELEVLTKKVMDEVSIDNWK